jgi:hypothetical protein
MSESDNFLSRWSRRKQEAKREAEPSADAVAGEQASEASADVPAAATAEPKPDGEKDQEFDLASLPSIDSIGAGTDIRLFLQKGVPAELTRAALRRAWTSDPAIRDFIEVAENQWDFATGKDLPGFGELQINPEDIRRMVAEVLEERVLGPETEPNPQQSVIADSAKPAENPQPVSSENDQPVVHRKEENVAMQQEPQQITSSLPVKRGHGGALPQ